MRFLTLAFLFLSVSCRVQSLTQELAPYAKDKLVESEVKNWNSFAAHTFPCEDFAQFMQTQLATTQSTVETTGCKNHDTSSIATFILKNNDGTDSIVSLTISWAETTGDEFVIKSITNETGPKLFGESGIKKDFDEWASQHFEEAKARCVTSDYKAEGCPRAETH